ncbi:MAG: acyl carrier protein [Chloroflexota bacterium]
MPDTLGMHDERLSGQVRELMADTFSVDESELPENPSQATFARWTSVLHMVLLVALEDQFGLTFSMDEMTTMTSLDRILAVLGEKSPRKLPA